MIAVLRVFLILAVSGVLLLACQVNTPRDYATFDLPGGKGLLVLRKWWGWSEEGNYDAALRTEAGWLESGMLLAVPWMNPRVNVYATPEGNIALLGTAHSDHFIAFDKDGRPGFVTEARFETANSDTWSYLGAFTENRGRALRFYAPEQLPECIALIGDMVGPIRSNWQEERCEAPAE